MLKELNSIARSLLGLHGYPTPPAPGAGFEPTSAPPRRRAHAAGRTGARVPAATGRRVPGAAVKA